MILRDATDDDLNYVKALYEEAFPRAERKPFRIIRKRVRQGLAHILILDEDGPKGLAITMEAGGSVLLDYFAVDPAHRGRGCGGRALDLLRLRYADRVFFLEIEALDPDAPNYDQRVRRKRFYQAHGMVDTGARIRLFGVPMELLSGGPPATFEQCDAVYRVIYRYIYDIAVQRL